VGGGPQARGAAAPRGEGERHRRGGAHVCAAAADEAAGPRRAGSRDGGSEARDGAALAQPERGAAEARRAAARGASRPVGASAREAALFPDCVPAVGRPHRALPLGRRRARHVPHGCGQGPPRAAPPPARDQRHLRRLDRRRLPRTTHRRRDAGRRVRADRLDLPARAMVPAAARASPLLCAARLPRQVLRLRAHRPRLLRRHDLRGGLPPLGEARAARPSRRVCGRAHLSLLCRRAGTSTSRSPRRRAAGAAKASPSC